ncbi:MerR family transcriptional regulator [Gordonia hankookensis]|uniref:MerR family transcriptional regulator n=1 Tax=Gordonia hankookensis TaxID=589403 RepID=A0ABR7WHX2_9ACTN|nr:MerR family transcriptional regulator [Gordonia hankookensis]MBD1322356.1 MerR family transcriptional regulator [Gordonia hankookensis]
MLIGEVSQHSGVSTRMLRHYDRLGLVAPAGRTSGGYREYSTDDIARLFRVEGLRSLGLSLAEVRRVLDAPGSAEPTALIGELVDQSRRRLAREEELLALLRRIEASTPADWEDVLRAVRLMHDLESDSAGVRYRAALAAMGHQLSSEAVADAVLAEADPNVSGALTWALAATGDAAGTAVLATGLRSDDVEVRRRAVSAVAELAGPGVADVLRGALTDTDVVVRSRAAMALGARGDRQVVPDLIDMVVAGTNDVDAADLLRDLAHHAGTADQVAADLGRLLDDEAVSPAARSRLAQALVEMPGEVAVGILTALVDDDDPAVAAVAAMRTHGR